MRNVILTSLFVLGLLAISSCTDDNTVNPNEPTICPSGSGERVAYVAPGDTVLWHLEATTGRQILGAGFDPNAAYLSEACVKASVLDLDKLRALDGGRVSVTAGTDSEGMSVASADAAGLLNELASKTQVLADGETAPLCAGTLLNDEVFQCDIDRSSMFSFSYQSANLGRYVLGANVTCSDVRRHPEEYLSDTFLADLASLSADDLIAKYGTHVLTRVKTGMAIRSVSRTAVLGEEGKETADWKRKVADYYGMWARHTYDVQSSINTSTNLYAGKYCGGTTSITFAGGDPSLVDTSKNPVDFTEWEKNGCTVDNAALLEILDSPVPLYELVSDEAKAEALREATKRHLAENELTTVETKLLVQTWKGGYYRYATTGYGSDRDGGVCGIFTERKYGMVPLYAYNNEFGCVMFTESTAADKSMTTAEGTEVLGYIYATQQPGTVPLYAAAAYGQTYLTLADSPTYGEQGTWRKAALLGYVIPPTFSQK